MAARQRQRCFIVSNWLEVEREHRLDSTDFDAAPVVLRAGEVIFQRFELCRVKSSELAQGFDGYGRAGASAAIVSDAGDALGA